MKSLRTKILLNQFTEFHVIIDHQNLARDPLSGRVIPGLHDANCTRFSPALGKLLGQMLGEIPRLGDGFRDDCCRYGLKISGGPLTRSTFKSTFTSTRSAIRMNGIPLFMPNSCRSNAIVPLISAWPLPL